LSVTAHSHIVVADDWVGLLTAYCLYQSGHDLSLLWVSNSNKTPNPLLREGIAPWQAISAPDTKTVQGFEFLMSQLNGVAAQKKGLLSLDVASAAELDNAEQWVMSESTQESDLQVLDEKVWVNIEPRLMSDAKLAIWRPEVAEVARPTFEHTLLDLLSQQGVEICLLEDVPSATLKDQRISVLTSSCGKEWAVDSWVLTSTHLVKSLLPEWPAFHPTESLISLFKVHPGFLKHLVQVRGLLLMPQDNGLLYVKRNLSSESTLGLIEVETLLWEALQAVYPEMAMFEPLESIRSHESDFIGSSPVFENVSVVLTKEDNGLLQAFHQTMQFSKQFNS